jgi:hypothetical protein
MTNLSTERKLRPTGVCSTSISRSKRDQPEVIPQTPRAEYAR